MAASHYTFGDSDLAARRLQKLAALYEPETISLLKRRNVSKPHLACDLGCGPGWSTRLVQRVLTPDRTVGLDASAKFIADAQRDGRGGLEFSVWDVTKTPFPIGAPDLLFCRFLLTHLSSPLDVLSSWARTASNQAHLLIHETESLETENPALQRYYELVASMQEHYGQNLLIGPSLEECLERAGWEVLESEAPCLRKPAHSMAELHLANIRNWRHDEFASRSFDPGEIDALETSLQNVASGDDNSGVVSNRARQIVARSKNLKGA
jgi:trans-aconitate 2-methyltransferase